MFANLIRLLTRSDPPSQAYNVAFVKEVQVRRTEPRSRRVEKFLLWGWIAVVLKCAFVWWAMRHYHVPFHPDWIILPTLGMAGVCTALYCWRR